MTETKFTPGPWEALFDKRRDNYSIFGGASKGARHWIANTKCESTPRDHAANAHLIAAAPELYAALEGAIGALEYSVDCARDDGNNEDIDFAQSKLDAALLVLATARGEDV